MTRDPTILSDEAPRPALVAVDDHAPTLKVVGGALHRRFGLDYEVVAAHSPENANNELERLRAADVDVAIIVANTHLPGEGTAFLAGTRDSFPTARRLVLARLGDNWVLPAIARAFSQGHVDHFDYLPASETDERFLASIGDILVDWAQASGRGDTRITVVGEPGDEAFQTVTDTLQRWETQPIATLEAGTSESDAFLEELGVTGPLPIVAIADGRVLTGATMATISDAVGSAADPRSTYDVVVVGLGPAGFSAAMNAASEGLRTILINDTFSQASSSPLVRNYLGFPAGVTGAELMRRAWSQVMMFGAAARIGRTATDIRRRGGRNVVSLDDGSEITADVVMLAIGADYRRIGVEGIDRLVGRGVFYGYGAMEAQSMTGRAAAVVGGANSAVQAAIHVARYASSVDLIVRGSTLVDSASDYLITQLDDLPNLTVHLESEVVDASDEQRLRRIHVRNRKTGTIVDKEMAGLFVMIGAVPRTDWLPKSIVRDDKGFILTGDDGPRAVRPDQFRLPFETTMPGVFALGDVRSGSVKRIAAAVGEGSAAVQEVHEYLARVVETAAAERERETGERFGSQSMQAEIAAAARK
jgi:thioredoxin reductase (NADPH)